MNEIVSSQECTTFRVERPDLNSLFYLLFQEDYCVIGPTMRNQSIVYEELRHMEDLPWGWTEETAAGSPRLQRRSDEALFGYAVGPHSWQAFAELPTRHFWHTTRSSIQMTDSAEALCPQKLAFIGLRPCEIEAMKNRDQAYRKMNSPSANSPVAWQHILVIAVNCGEASNHCHCGSKKLLPKVQDGYDLAITEIVETERHYFVVEIGTEYGRDLLLRIPHQPATFLEREAAYAQTQAVTQQVSQQPSIPLSLT